MITRPGNCNMTSESEVRALTSAQEQFLALFHSLPSDTSRRSFGLWLRDAALPDLLSAPAGPGTDYDGVLMGRELLNSISGREEVVCAYIKQEKINSSKCL